MWRRNQAKEGEKRAAVTGDVTGTGDQSAGWRTTWGKKEEKRPFIKEPRPVSCANTLF